MKEIAKSYWGRFLCWLLFHQWKGSATPYVYECQRCPARIGGHE